MNRDILQHREVVERALGRLLRSEETVHHRNGIRHDNRPENLELWTRDHGAGVRVKDVVQHAMEMLARYAPEMLTELARSHLTPTPNPATVSVCSL